MVKNGTKALVGTAAGNSYDVLYASRLWLRRPVVADARRDLALTHSGLRVVHERG